MIPSPKPGPRKKAQKKQLKSRRDSLEKECDEIWRDIIYMKAGFKSQLSGTMAVLENGRITGLNAHHIAKKPNYWLRYSLLNGFCCTPDEHSTFHFEKTPSQYEDGMKRLVGEICWFNLMEMKHDTAKAYLTAIKEDLLFQRRLFIQTLSLGPLAPWLTVYLAQRKISS